MRITMGLGLGSSEVRGSVAVETGKGLIEVLVKGVEVVFQPAWWLCTDLMCVGVPVLGILHPGDPCLDQWLQETSLCITPSGNSESAFIKTGHNPGSNPNVITFT